MATLLIHDTLFQKHVMPQGHPERPARLEAIDKALSLPLFDALKREGARAGDPVLAELVHPAAHVRAIG
ncbi:MAG TPA: histone deacetylase family protein, partial [Beijerinckiaceae bacterium]|nr:histone deacetylase family protein [Beijerinckiaceae bacterium]